MQVLTFVAVLLMLLAPQVALAQDVEASDSSTVTIAVAVGSSDATVSLEPHIVLTRDDWSTWREHTNAKRKVLIWQGAVGGITGGLVGQRILWETWIPGIVPLSIGLGLGSAVVPTLLSNRRWTDGQASATIGMSQLAAINGALIGELATWRGEGVLLGAPAGALLGFLPGHYISLHDPDPNAWAGVQFRHVLGGRYGHLCACW